MYNQPFYNQQANLDRINAQMNELEKIRQQLQQPVQQPTNLTQNFQIAPTNRDVMRYEEYGRYNAYSNYGDNYGRENYGRRGYDRKYRGYENIDRMSDHYGRYMDNKERYGANEDTKRSLKYMLESMEDFARMLKEDAKSQEEVEMIRQTAQRIAQM